MCSEKRNCYWPMIFFLHIQCIIKYMLTQRKFISFVSVVARKLSKSMWQKFTIELNYVALYLLFAKKNTKFKIQLIICDRAPEEHGTISSKNRKSPKRNCQGWFLHNFAWLKFNLNVILIIDYSAPKVDEMIHGAIWNVLENALKEIAMNLFSLI